MAFKRRKTLKQHHRNAHFRIHRRLLRMKRLKNCKKRIGMRHELQFVILGINNT